MVRRRVEVAHGERQAVEARRTAAARLRRPARTTSRTTSPNRKKAWRTGDPPASPSRVRSNGTPSRSSTAAIVRSRSGVRTTTWSIPVTPSGAGRSGGVAPDGAGPTSVGSPSTSVDRRALRCPDRAPTTARPGRPERGVDPQLHRSQPAQPVGVERRRRLPARRRDRRETRSSTRRVTRPRPTPSCHVKNASTSASSSACLCSGLPCAVTGAALLVQEDRSLVLARRGPSAAAPPSCGRGGGRPGCRPRRSSAAPPGSTTPSRTWWYGE